jgi:hypothetical protein
MIKLIHKQSGKILLETQNDNNIVVHDPVLKAIFEKSGILIPPFRRAEYGGQSLVFFNDPYFPKALCEVFYPFELDPKRYELVTS